MSIKKISPDLYEIENFISDEELNEIMNFINTLEEKDWYFDDSDDFWNGKRTQYEEGMLKKLTKRVNGILETNIDNTGLAIQRFKKDEYIKEHRDYWIYDLDHHIRFGLVLYLNDNYEGGEIYYPELDIKIKPKSRSLFIHGGNILHQSMPVISDSIRYFSTCFFRGTKERPVLLNKEMFYGIEESDGSIYD